MAARRRACPRWGHGGAWPGSRHVRGTRRGARGEPPGFLLLWYIARPGALITCHEIPPRWVGLLRACHEKKGGKPASLSCLRMLCALFQSLKACRAFWLPAPSCLDGHPQPCVHVCCALLNAGAGGQGWKRT